MSTIRGFYRLCEHIIIYDPFFFTVSRNARDHVSLMLVACFFIFFHFSSFLSVISPLRWTDDVCH